MLELLLSTSGPCWLGGDSLPGDIGGDTGGGSGDCRGGAARPASNVWKGGVDVEYIGAENKGGRDSGAPRYCAPKTGELPYLWRKIYSLKICDIKKFLLNDRILVI